MGLIEIPISFWNSSLELDRSKSGSADRRWGGREAPWSRCQIVKDQLLSRR